MLKKILVGAIICVLVATAVWFLNREGKGPFRRLRASEIDDPVQLDDLHLELADSDPASWVRIYRPCMASSGFNLVLYRRRVPMIIDMNGNIVHVWPKVRAIGRARLLRDGLLAERCQTLTYDVMFFEPSRGGGERLPRAGRVFLEGGIYHVYNRISRGENVFAEEEEASAFVGLLREVKERDGLVVFAWTLMSNHYHVALRTGAVPLSRSMRSLQQRVTRGYNVRHRVFGPLWQGRYRAKLVKDQRYLDGLLAYIHLNPVSAGRVDDPAEYRWSGHREIVRRTRQPITDVDEVLVLFGKTRRSARQAYVRAIKGAVVEPWVGEAPGKLPWWRLGRPKAGEDEAPEADATVAFIDELGRSTGLERPPVDAPEFLDEGAAFLGIRMEDLAGRGRAPGVVRGRELLATLGVERYGLRVGDIAAAFNKSAEAGSRMVSRGIAKRQCDTGFREDLEELDSHIARRRERRITS